MEEEPSSDTLEGTTEPTVVDAGRVFVNTGPEFPVQKNQAAKVIGILLSSGERSIYSDRH